MQRVRSVWTGVGGTGLTTMYWDESTAGAVAVTRAFWVALASLLPNEISIQVENSGDLISAATGEINGSWSEASVAVVNGTDAGDFAAPAGAVIRWNTNGIVAGRRVRGRTFVVPIGATGLETNGQLAATAVTALDNAAEALIADATTTPQVWHRPTNVPPSNGSAHTMTSATVSSKVAVLRSRRD